MTTTQPLARALLFAFLFVGVVGIRADDGWADGRASWYSNPWIGSCGYGKLDPYEFKLNAVAAMPDTAADFATGSCGRCYEIKCRGIQAISADGSVNIDRHDACYDTSKSIVIKIVDTCPCHGNEKWCCGDMPHFDLGKEAFARLASNDQGIIGLKWRAVPCAAQNVTATAEQWTALQNNIALGADPSIFVGGEIGQGWVKTVYGDANQAVATSDPSVVITDEGSKALCDEYHQYGGCDFHSDKAQIATLAKAKGVEFWAMTKDGIPDMTFHVANMMRGSCQKQLKMADGATQDSVAGWTRFSFPLDAFDCTGSITKGDLNRLQWENLGSGASVKMCLKDVRAVMQEDKTVASAGRR